MRVIAGRAWQTMGAPAGVLLAALAALPGPARPAEPEPTGFRFPTVPPEHKHVRTLLENALRYAAPDNKMTDAASGYPFEGWNHDPKKQLFLRSFTQLTAIGQWMELLGNIAAGVVEIASFHQRGMSENLRAVANVGEVRHGEGNTLQA